MNKREKFLIGAVAATVVIYLGFNIVKSQVIERRKNLARQITQAEQRYESLESELARADTIKEGWQKQTRRTLSGDPYEAQRIFREDVTSLLKRNKLEDGVVVNDRAWTPIKKGTRKGFVELNVTVKVDGKLADLSNFLRDLYQRPYLVRVGKLNINAKQPPAVLRLGKESDKDKKPGRHGKRDAPDYEPIMQISMTVTTLVLPKVEGIENETLDLAAVDDPNNEEVYASTAYLRQDDFTAYDDIASTNFFRVYVPPPPPEPPPQIKPDPPKVVEREPDREPVRPPPDPRRDADKWVVSGTAALDGEPLVYVHHVSGTKEPDVYHLNDEVDDGRLVLIDYRGIVVRAPASSHRGGGQYENYFYALGSTFKERVVLDPAEYADIDQQLQQILAER